MITVRRVLGFITLVFLLFVGVTNYVMPDLDMAQLWDSLQGGHDVDSQPSDDQSTPGTSSIRTTAEEIRRAECLLGHLPNGVKVFGYMPALPRRMEDPGSTMSSLRVRGREYGIYYLTQWALAPHTITFYNSHPWIIANYSNRVEGLSAIAEVGYSIIVDCQNGVFLLKK